MKNIYFAVALLFIGFTSCKNNDKTDDDNLYDSTSVEQNTMGDKDSIISDSTSTEMDSATNASSDVKLPNKMSATTKVIPGEKGKYALAETKWELVELNGKSVEETTRRDYFINFDSKTGTFKAFVGCNKIAGSYFMKSTNKLGFSNTTITRKSCDNIEVEREFFNNLQKVDNYMIEGTMLHLHIGKKAVAKFEAIK